MCLREPGDPLDLLVGEVGSAEGDVLAHAGREEERVLRDHTDRAPQRGELHVAHVGTVDEHAARGDVVEARDQRRQRRLPGARLSDQRDRAAGGDVELDPVEHGAALEVFEADVLEAQVAAAGRQLDRVRPLGDLLRLVHDLEDPLARGSRALRLADPHAERAQRHHQHAEVEVESDEAADRERAARHHPRADEQHCALGEERYPRDERHVHRPLPVGLQRLPEDVLGARMELRRLLRLLGERLHHVDAHDVLLGDGRDVGQLLLHLTQGRVGEVAVAVGEGDEHGRDRQRDQRELPLEDEQHRGHRDDGQDVLEEEDQAVAEEEAHALQVDRRA